ncbi:MAG: hypothetical protein V4638_11250 [Bacteroidota bacterium]
MSSNLPDINLNSFEDVDKAIASFKRLVSKKGLNDETVKVQFFEKFGTFFLLCKYYESGFLSKIPMFRVRPANKIDNPKDIKQFGAPPIDEKCGLGRANLNGRNVFYGSSNALGALIETKEVYKGNQFYVGRWVFNEKKYGTAEIAVTSYIDTKKKTRGLWKDILLPSDEEQLAYFEKYYGKEKSLILLYLVKELGKLFMIKSERYYPLTGFLADQVIYSPNNPMLPNFLLYPSVINSSFLNLALHPNFIQDYYILEKIVKVEVIGELKNNSLKVLPTEFGLVEDEELHFLSREINLDERFFIIDKLNCACGQSIEFDNPEELPLTNSKNNSQKNLKEVVEVFLAKHITVPDYNDVLNNLFEKDGLPVGIKQQMSLYLEDWTVKMPDDIHKALAAECQIVQPFKYTKL